MKIKDGVARSSRNSASGFSRRSRFTFYTLSASLILTGCSLTARFQESAQEAADQTEAAMRETRENYHDRFDRISIQWMCTGMSYEDLVQTLGGHEEAKEFYNRVCTKEPVE